MLNEFRIQYDKAVNSRIAVEEDEDFITMNSRAVLSSVHPIEAKAGKLFIFIAFMLFTHFLLFIVFLVPWFVGKFYTRKIFEKFEKEWKEATNNLTHDTLNKSLEHVAYNVGQLNVEKKYWRIVKFNLLNKVDDTCSCTIDAGFTDHVLNL